ncbi:hypothetical protein STEG23_010543, partial [Scotinomys teguina]
ACVFSPRRPLLNIWRPQRDNFHPWTPVVSAPDFDRSSWLNEKFKLGLDFPNLPYLIDGSCKITQSNAILRYLARKHNLCGETEEERIRVDILENQAMDTRMQLAMVCYSPDFEKRKPEYLEGLSEKMKLYSEFLGKRPWFAGDKITYVDFLIYDILDQQRTFQPHCLDAFPNLKDFLARFELTHPIRLLLEYTDSSYEEKRYTMGGAPNFDRSQWLSEKFNLGLDIPNLPYLIDGSHKVTQSNAILRYIARKHNLCEWGCRVEHGQPPCLGWGGMLREKQKPEFLKAIPDKMKVYSEFLGKRSWFAGDKITYVDFLAYDILDQYRMFEPKCLDAFPNLKDFLARFEGLKKISAYMKSSRFLPRPVFTKEKRKPEYLEGLPDQLKLYSEFLGKQPWFAGDKITYVDFLVYDILDQHRLFEPKCLDAFPNLKDFLAHFELPYLIDGSHKITQSNAILRYLARKHNLCGETEEERVRVDILENQVMDSRIRMGMLCYSPDFEKRKPEFLEGLPDQLKLYSEFLGEQPWFAGDKITYVDFLVYDILDQHRLFEPKCLDAFPNLKDFLAHFEGLKKISAYMKSSRFLPSPMYLKQAMWGNCEDLLSEILVPVFGGRALETTVVPEKLAYLIDGSCKITQSNTILRYLARKHNLCGETEEERIRVDILENQLMDTPHGTSQACYNPDFEKLKPGYLEQLPGMMKLYSEFLGKRPWFAGNKITFVDFIAYDVLEKNQVFKPKCLDAFPNLKDFISHFELPYLIDGSHKVTQSNANLRYLARKHNLCGETEEEKIHIDILENQAMGTRT